MSKVESKRKIKLKSSNDSKLSWFRIILLSSFITLIVGGIFALVQFIGEMLGFLPVIQLGNLGWGELGDPIIVFIVGFLLSIFIGSFLVLILLRYRMNKL